MIRLSMALVNKEDDYVVVELLKLHYFNLNCTMILYRECELCISIGC